MPPPKGQAYYSDGKPIADVDLPKAIAEGTARWRKGDTVPFVAPDGSSWDIPAEHAQTQLSKGWRPTSAHEQTVGEAKRKGGSMAEVLGAGALSFAEDLPGGRLVTDRFVSEQEREILRAKAPLATALGSGLSLATPLLPLKGAGLAGRALGAVTAPARGVAAAAARVGAAAGARVPTALAGTVEAGVASGLEGATYAAGNELARQARGDSGFNAEALASAMGEVGLYGAAAGVGLRGVGAGLSRTAKSGADTYRGLMRGLSGADDALVKTGERIPEHIAWGAKSMGITSGQARVMNQKKLQTAIQEMMDSGVIKREGVWAAAADDLVAKAARFKQAHADLGEVKIPGVYDDADKLMGKMPDMRPSALVQDAIASPEMLARKQGVVEVLTARLGDLRSRGDSGKYAKIADKLESDWLEPLMSARSLKELHKIDIDLRREADKIGEDMLGDAMRGLRGDLKSKIREIIGEVSPELGGKLRRFDELYESFAMVRKPIAQAAAGSQQKTVTGMTPWEASVAAGGLAFGTPGIGAVISGAHMAMRYLKGSDRFAAGMARATENVAGQVGKQRVTISGALQKAAERFPIRINPGTPGRLVALTQEYHERAGAAQQAVYRPQATLMRLASNLEPVARVDPDQARQIAGIYADDLAWLASRVPKSLTPQQDMDLTLQRAKQRAQAVAPSEAAKFVRTSRALSDPIKEVAKVSEKGALPAPETAAVLAERRPKIREQIEKEFDAQAMKLAAKGQQMDYKTRVQASILTGKAYDSSMTPESISFNQGRWSLRFQQQPVVGSGAGPGTRRGRVSRETRGRLTRFRTTAEETMNTSDL